MIVYDSPLENIGEDRFKRGPIVEVIVDSINHEVKNNHDCLVYGIYGKWGEGKTTFMNFLRGALESQGKIDGINLVSFNPWLVNNDEALLREFFKSIMNDPDESIRQAFKKYGSLAIFASKTIINAAAPGIGSALAKGIKWAQKALEDSEDTLAGLKTKASEAIVNSGRHLVVMIDDVDRLDKDELHAVLRLIRQVADFKNSIYIVAMDVDMVAKSIGAYYGKGGAQDGREFLDKIIQVPITLPLIPKCDMLRFVTEDISAVLQSYMNKEEEIGEIAKAVEPFIGTYRNLKRYCNQLSFVLPHLKDEVNIKDLCILEAIKMLCPQSYNRIHDCQSPLRYEVPPSSYSNDNNKQREETEKRYQRAKEYIEEGLEGVRKDIVDKAIDDLFGNRSYDYQVDLDKKRLLTDVYAPKYFTMTVPPDLIPDRELDVWGSSIFEVGIEKTANQLDEWVDGYSDAEAKRAALYLIRRHKYGEERCKAASILAKSLSLCKIAKGLYPHIYIDPQNIADFVVYQVIYSYMFVQDPNYVQMNVLDEGILNETLSFIFEKGEMNYCMNVLCSADVRIFNSGVYDGREVLPILFERFSGMGHDEQFRYSKFMLVTFLNRWKRVNMDSFNEYAKELIVNPKHDFGSFLSKFIDGTDDEKDVANFVGLFELQIPVINERLGHESEEVRTSHAAKMYARNYIVLLRK